MKTYPAPSQRELYNLLSGDLGSLAVNRIRSKSRQRTASKAEIQGVHASAADADLGERAVDRNIKVEIAMRW